MQNNKLSPLKIKLDKKERSLFIDWNDNHKSRIGFGLLRAACPCATCRGGHENMKPEPDLSVFENKLPISIMTEIGSLDIVGSYGLSIMWADGHHYGIYTWQYLKALCDCEDCRIKRN
ncbi:MAG: hypothetical protein CVU41_10990 [Chloroflexi bacterium HGW-Chloroflexi-3]|nr:MAG: hypothetical protein CVU41_10990 [Chloroflexi bacterium HGW-Chloroflexi-3]